MLEKYTSTLDEVCDPLSVTKFAKQFSIDRHEAVKIIEQYINEKKSDGPLWALYEVTGLVDVAFLPSSDEVLKISVVPDKELESVKKSFKKIISTSLHSIQRTNPKETRVYGRQWENNDDLIGVTIPVPSKSSASTVSEPVVKKEKSSTPEPKVAEKTKVSEKPKEVKVAKKQASVMSMFSKAKPKTENTPEPKAEKSSKVDSKKEPKVRAKVVVSSSSEDEEEEVEEMPLTPERSPSPVIEKKGRKRPKIEIDDDDDDDNSNSSSISRQKSCSPEEEIEEKVAPKAKRSKIVDNDENKKEGLLKFEKIEKKAEKTPTKSAGNERRRTTKIEKVVETFVDEDGFLVSKEVNKEVEASPQKSAEKPKPKVITAPIPGQAKVAKKNASITSFFKKA